MSDTQTLDVATASTVAPSTSMLAPEVIAEANFNAALAMVGLCISDAMTVLTQGLRPDNAAKRGGIAIGLRRAAWQIGKGTSVGFMDAEMNYGKPMPDLSKLFDEIARLRQEATHVGVSADLAVGQFLTTVSASLSALETAYAAFAPKKAKTLGD